MTPDADSLAAYGGRDVASVRFGRLRSRLALAALALLACADAAAHATSTGLATLDLRGERPVYALTLDDGELGDGAADLRRAAGGDPAAVSRIGAGLNDWLALTADGERCRIARTRLQAAADGQARLGVRIEFGCDAHAARLELTDRWHTLLGEHHRTLMRVNREDDRHDEHVLDREHDRVTIAADAAQARSFGQFFSLGLGHILAGADHLLFVGALLLGAAGLSALLWTVTAFTVAHSVALAAAVLGWVHVSPAIVEPLIAASIVWVVVENLRWPGAPPWRRSALAFAFGLLHGLAFSEALQALDVSGWPLVRALGGFNLGVEAGQALVVLIVAPVLAWLSARRPAWPIRRVGSMLIGAAGAFWLVERLIAGG